MLLGSFTETQNRGRYLSYHRERRSRASLHGQAVLVARMLGWVVGFPRPSTDAADTSSFTLSRQRENIAALEVGCNSLTRVVGLRSRLRHRATIQDGLPRRLSSKAGLPYRRALTENR